MSTLMLILMSVVKSGYSAVSVPLPTVDELAKINSSRPKSRLCFEAIESKLATMESEIVIVREAVKEMKLTARGLEDELERAKRNK